MTKRAKWIYGALVVWSLGGSAIFWLTPQRQVHEAVVWFAFWSGILLGWFLVSPKGMWDQKHGN